MFWHFLKVVYSRACESRGVWIKVRKLKNKKILTFFANPCTIVRTLLITCYENKGWLRLTESKGYKTFIFIRSAQRQQRMFIRYCGCFTFREK